MPRGNIKMLYYFCYGSPLMDRGLDRRVDSLRLEGQGRLEGWRLSFSRQGGQPNLEAAEGSRTWGCLYLIEESRLPLLDREEAGGQRREGQALFEGRLERCVFYTYPPLASSRPEEGFLAAFRSTYEQASLPQAQLDQGLAPARP